MDETEQPEAIGQVIQIDEFRIRDHLGEMVCVTVDKARYSILDTEEDRLYCAGLYERKGV